MKQPTISQRGYLTPASPIRKLAPYAEQAKKKGFKVYHLNIGQPDIETPQEFFNAIHQYEEKVVAYNPSNGIPIFLKQLRDYYHRCNLTHLETEDIMVTTGGSEAIIFSMMAVTSPGDEIITFEPFYPNYNGFASMAGIKIVPVGTDPHDGYRMPSKEDIEKMITEKTKAILICSPNNPTGTVFNHEEMSRIKDIAIKHGLYVLSDEVYREFAFENPAISILSFPELADHAIVMDSLSKRYSACGARIGCIVSKNTEFMQTVLKFGQARLCPPTLEQIGSAAVVEVGDKYFDDMLEEYKQRRNVLYDGLMQIEGVEVKKPGGAFYMMVTFPVKDIEDFTRWLLADFDDNGETVMMAPGPGFYATTGRGSQEARIAYVLNQTDLLRAVEILKKAVKTYNCK
ncbi:pyridoxal phosphate-dependent aminotransferase [bacterium]|nr:pyridoxal phosphate-dependent aminotransferase [bacterium]